MRYFLVVCVFIFVWGCNSPDKLNEVNNNQFGTILIPEPVQSEQAQVINNLEYIILEAKDSAYYGYVSKMRVHKGKIYVFDSRHAKTVLIYSLAGKHLKTIGSNVGLGPGEFVSVSNFEIDYVNNQLLVMDNFGHKFMLYTLGGEFIREIKSDISVTDAALLPNGLIMHTKSSYSYKVSEQSGKDCCIYIADEQKQIVKEGFEYDDNKNLNIHAYGIIRSLPDGKFNYAPKFRDTIYNVSYDSITPKYAIDYGKNKKIEKKDIDKLASTNELFASIKMGNMCFMGDHVESENHLYLMIGSWFSPTAVFYNKLDKKTIAVSYTKNSIDSDLYDLMCADSDGYFYGVFNSAEIDSIIDLFPELNSMKSDDPNPILFRYKINL